MKTYFPKPGDATIIHDWYIVDAHDIILGKLAVVVADLLRGKNKAIFTPHTDTGDYVVVINAKEIKVTGKKMQQKMYRAHSGYMGNLKELRLEEMLAKNPALVIEKAVKGMLPKNKMQKELMKKLKVYPGAEHPHAAQQPKVLKI
jgi:large subunit ribosomal protein L13